MNYYINKIESLIKMKIVIKMIQLVAEIEQANADSPDIFDYIVEAIEIVIIQIVRCVNYLKVFC
jgi:hypothetical protein